MANRRYNTQVAQPRGADRVKRAGGGMGGRSGPMMYSRGQGVNMRSKRVPTELMDRGAMKKGGKVIKPKGPGVLRPKPTDRYGQQMKPKPIRPGKKDGGMLKPVKPGQKGLAKLPKEVRNKMGYMKDGGRAKKFPDLSGDGKVTKKDVLMGRGIIPRKVKDLKPGTVDTAKKIIKKGKK